MARESPISGKSIALLSALCLATIPAAASADSLAGGPQDAPRRDGISQGRSETGGQSYGDRNRGGRSGFYSYPSHRHIDSGSSAGLDRPLASRGSARSSRDYDANHGSAYYGRNYGAPYFGGGYYDDGVYYRERRD